VLLLVLVLDVWAWARSAMNLWDWKAWEINSRGAC
jgi:hypothetical protein